MKASKVSASIADRLKEARGSLKKTQPEMAAAAGIPLDTYKKYEGGKATPGGEALSGVARCGINVNWLLTGDLPMLVSPLLEADAVGAQVDLLSQILRQRGGQERYDERAGQTRQRYKAVQAAYEEGCTAIGYRPAFNVGEALKAAMMSHGLQSEGLLPILEAMAHEASRLEPASHGLGPEGDRVPAPPRSVGSQERATRPERTGQTEKRKKKAE